MENEIKKIILEKYGSLSNFCKRHDFPWSTVNGMLTRGLKNSSVTTVIKLCNALNLDIEEIAKGNIAYKSPTNVNPDDYMLIACHHETGKLTDDEKEEINQFAEFVKHRKKN